MFLQVWKFSTQGSIYSSPCIFQSEVYFGSHDKNLYSINISTGKFNWKVECDSVVYSSPCFLPWNEKSIICVCSSKGEIILVENSGKILQKMKMKGELFSSAVMIPGYVVVGSRHNELYILRM